MNARAPIDFDRSSEYLRLTLPLMSKYKVPVTPENYAVWYEYVSGGNLSLTEAIDDLIKKKQPIGEELTCSLHKRYVEPADYGPLMQAQKVFNRIADRVANSLSTAADETAEYESSLNDVTQKISADMSTEQIRSLVGVLTLVTTQMSQGNQSLREHLEESRSEAEGLRDELARVKSESLKDTLTGLANRKAFHDELDRLQLDADELAKTCVLFADIDRFKQVNDEYGHLFGDKVIMAVAKVLDRVVGERGLSCRYGGEEFAVLLPKNDPESARSLAEDIRDSVERGRVINPKTGEKLGAVTISIGVSKFDPAEDVYQSIEKADAALYKAKDAGRNRVEMA